MLVILARPDLPSNPFMVFDNKKTLALFRDKNEIIKLTDIHRTVLHLLKTSGEVIVTEMDEDSHTIRRYTTKLIHDSRLKSKLKREKEVLL